MQTKVRCVAAMILLMGVVVTKPGGARASSKVKLYVTNSLGDDITVIDLGALQVVGDIKVGEHVHGAAAQADGERLFTTVESDRTLKIIDTASDKIIETIKLTGRPNQCAVTPNGRFVGVPIRDGNTVDIVDVEQKKVVKSLPVRVPHNCYNAGNDGHIFVTSMGEKKVNLIDLNSMTYLAAIPVGGIPRPIAVSKSEKAMYVALSDLHGFVIVDVPGRKVVQTVQLPRASASLPELEPHTPTHGLALTPNGRELWVTSVIDDGLYVYDIATGTLSKEIPTGRGPIWLAFSPDGKYCCVSNAGSDDCSIIDARTRKEVARLKVGRMPKRLVVVEAP